jgi:hypothetical protein
MIKIDLLDVNQHSLIKRKEMLIFLNKIPQVLVVMLVNKRKNRLWRNRKKEKFKRMNILPK